MTHHNNFWRLVRENAEQAVKGSGEPPVRLRGGPSDGWVVMDDAPMLRDDWHTTWLDSIKAEFKPGHYVLVDEMDQDARVAVWKELLA